MAYSETDSVVKLILKDNQTIEGKLFGFPVSVAGEVVFNTAMTGYPESITDPSYKGQILVLTYPLIGNYGVPDNVIENQLSGYFESENIQVSGLIISDYSAEHHHWNARKSLSGWLYEHQIPGIYGVDTRSITKLLREKGTMLGKIIVENKDVDFYEPDEDNLVRVVSTKEKIVYGGGRFRILLIDCGVKHNIIRHLLKRDTTVIRVPWDHDIAKEEYDGIFISNGPGDPKKCRPTIEQLKLALNDSKPVFGICLGNQLLALASGADTYKLKYGHRSHNQPVIMAHSNHCYITSQNHGFAVDETTLGKDWEPLFTNLNDGTNEGLRHLTKPVFSSQFHPEASSGPTDTGFLFDEFIAIIQKSKR
jgi:carbamoyl-phosphate synthase small subunit